VTNGIRHPSEILARDKGGMIKIRDLGKLLDTISHLLQQPLHVFHISLGIFLANIQVHRNVLRDFAEVDDWNGCGSVSFDVLGIGAVVVLSEVVEEGILAVVKVLLEGAAAVYFFDV